MAEELKEKIDTEENLADDSIILAEGLVKIYKTSTTEVMALQGLDLEIKEGEFTAIIGNSGSGKSTFLNMIGGLDRPSAGSLKVCGKNLFTMTDKELVLYKRNTVGFVWQNNGRNLLPYLTAIENVMLPMTLASAKQKKEKALMLLERVGMAHKKNSVMNMMSGGEQQRIAIAIALANDPKLLLADEPTGSVDRATADYIFDLFKELNREGQTILVVTHDTELSKKVERVVAIRDGKISSERLLKQEFAKMIDMNQSLLDFDETQEEYAILDRAGRVQIPASILKEMELDGNKVKISLKDGEVVITRP